MVRPQELKLGACGLSARKPGEAPEIAKQKDTLPTKKELQEVVPSHCFERSSVRSLSLVARDGVIIAAVGYLGWQLPTENIGVFGYALWNMYWFTMGTALTGWWVLAHECGHRGFSANNLINDSVGFVLHSLLLVPYFSWQYSHAKHHAKTNHMLDGESHVPPSTTWRKAYAKFHAMLGDEALAIYQLLSHLLFGWPAYLFFNATGARRTPEGVRHTTIPDHFRPNSKLFPSRGNWALRVAASTLGVVAALVGIYMLGSTFGHKKISMMYWPAYLWVNFWLVLYTWLQHTDEDLPHFGEDEWTWVRGALCTIDRPYGIFDWMHHNIGSTHVCHHLFSSIPCYHAPEATAALREYLTPKGLYNYDGQPWWRAAWRVSSTCHYMPQIQGVCVWRNLGQDSREKKQKMSSKKSS